MDVAVILEKCDKTWQLQRFWIQILSLVRVWGVHKKGQRDNFTREPPCLQQSILGVPVCMKPSLTSVSRKPDTHGSYVTFMPVESWSEMSKAGKEQHVHFFGRLGIEESEHLRMRWRNVWTREKNAVPPDTGAGASYQTSHPGISARAIAFGRSWPFAAFCYRPCLPVRHWGRDMSAPKPYVTNPTPTHSSKPPLSI